MHVWSLSLILTTLICCFTDCARSKSCRYNFQCDLGIEICCAATRTCTRRSDCPRRCLNDSDCSLGEKCSYTGGLPAKRAGFCYTGERPTLKPLYTLNWKPVIFTPFTWKPVTPRRSFTVERFTFNPDYCVWDSDCRGSSICREGKCVKRDFQSSTNVGIFPVIIIPVCVGIAVVAAVCSCCICKLPRNRQIPGGVTRELAILGEDPPLNGGARPGANGQEMQSRIAAPNVTAVEVENDFPSSPDAPPSYNSLEFQRQENGGEDFPEQPPPSYTEAVGSSTVTVSRNGLMYRINFAH